MEPSSKPQNDPSIAQQQIVAPVEEAPSPDQHGEDPGVPTENAEETRQEAEPRLVVSTGNRSPQAENLEGVHKSTDRAGAITDPIKPKTLQTGYDEGSGEANEADGGQKGYGSNVTKDTTEHHLVEIRILLSKETTSIANSKQIKGAVNEEDPPSQLNACATNQMTSTRDNWSRVQSDIENSIEPLPSPSQRQASMNSTPGAYPQGGMSPFARAQLTIGDVQPLENVTCTSEKSSLISFENLAVANPVIGGGQTAGIPLAQEWSQSAHEEPSATTLAPYWRKYKVLLSCPCILLIAALVTVGTKAAMPGAGGQTHQHDQDGAASILQGQSPEEYLISELPQYTLEKLEDTGSPQARAFQWLLGDPKYQSGSYQAWRVIQRYALATFYYSTGGDSSSGWINSGKWMGYDHHECNWYMTDPDIVYEHDENQNNADLDHSDIDRTVCSGEVLQNIFLVANQLKGSLPRELFLLTNLKVLSLRSNKLSGSLPSHFRRLSNLLALDLTSNEITGSIPTELGLLSKMGGLFLINNQMTGTIPTQVGAMTALRFLFAEFNKLTGHIPSQLGAMPRLFRLGLIMNFLTGTLPTQLANVPGSISVFGNVITGNIPSEFGRNQNIDLLVVGNSPLTGTLPTQLGTMQAMAYLTVWKTLISGTIPTELGNLSNMVGLQLSHNSIDGTIPSELAQLSSLAGLILADNNITGTVPTKLGCLTGLFAMQLNQNNLSGSIPTQFGSLPNLETLDLSGNLLSGFVPSELGKANSIQELRLDHNRLTGPIPTSIGLLFHKGSSRIEILYDMNFDYVPEELQTGIPTRTLRLGNNRLVGPIPSEMGLMKNLHSFAAEENFLTGRIPSQLGLLSRLEELVLNSNLLSGYITPQLGEALSLTILNIANNSLTGTIPVEYCDLGSPRFAFDCTGILCGCDCSC